MVDKVEEMHARIATFDEYCIPLSKEDTFLAWSTMEYPKKRVADASNETEMRIEMDKVRMMDKLAIEKNQFDEMLQQFEVDVRRAKQYSDYASEQSYVEEINGLQDAITEAKNKAKDFNAREQVFGFPPTEYAELDAIELELNPYWDLWNMISDFHTNLHEWLHGTFLDLDGAKIQREVEIWWKQSYKLKGQLEETTPGAADCAGKLREETSKFRENLPLIQALASPALKERHWSNLSDKIGQKITPYDDHGVELTLHSLLEMNVGSYIEEIQEVCVAAEKEYGLERGLQAMKDEWSLVQFDVKAYKETGTSIVGGIDEIIALLDDHLVKTQTMCGSMFIKAIEEDAKAWESQLKYAQALIDEWIACQRVWMYLEPIFGSEDIMRQLPTEARRFNDVDKLWRATMKATEEDPVFIAQADPAKKLKRKWIRESTANKGNVERWLLELENLQWESVRRQVELSLEEYPTMERTAWTLNWPAQAVIATSAIFWTSDVNKTIETGGYAALNEYVLELNKGLTAIVMLVRGQLSKLQRKTLSALVVMDVHSRDTCVSMATAQVDKVSDFNWQSQLRYYWEPSWKDGQAVKKGQKTAVARIVNARCLYGYEYLGNSMRLVITPLTDRCYRTMISAIDLLYGGAPEGPAGTGKTETVKDLSKAMAIQCVVFNCSDGLDYKAMAKFFKGLAGCGSWCCFDEFNRINVEVLSVIAQQILTINKGKAAGVEKFQFEGTFMKLNPNANPFITMNPGYAGRAELPDNLKALFRPCAMMVPDYALIGEIRLYSFGFEDARRNAQKLVRTLQLCSEQLSSQKHYDYGMRAVNSILVAAGNLRLKVGDDPAWDESKIVLRSVMDVNLPKFTVEDLPLFRGITSDLFPGVELPTADHGALIPTIDEICWSGAVVAPGREYKLEPLGSFTLKIVQLYEMVLVRHGVMIVGQTLSGKTARSAGEPFEKVNIHTMNPKSIKSGQLYGNFDENTHEWSDGILAVIFRNCAMDTGKDRMWVMFDGPVDAVWIENMNTVLDDNKKLCLMSGEIIKMTDRMTMMFEAEDLEQASPATVSRVGMIFCETRNLGWKPFLSVWTETLEEPWAAHAELFGELYEWLFPPMTYFVDKFCAVPTPITLIELMRASLRLLDCFMADAAVAGIGNDVPRSVEGLFILAIVWSVGACVDFEGRKKFDAFLRILLSGDAKDIEGSDEYVDFKNKTPAYDDEVKRASNLAPPAEGGSVHDFKFHCKTGTWASWVEPGSRFSIPKDAEFNSVVVPTVDTTSANQTQDIIDSKLDKRRKGVLGPPLGKTCFIFVDDLNMPAKEEFGAQPPIEILRQWMDHAGWYNREENSSRSAYVRHFNMINFVPFNQESLTRVFLTILDWSLGSYNNAVKSLSGAVVDATISIYEAIASGLLPTPMKSHYTFNLRDLSKVFQGLSQGHPDVIDGKEAFVSLWCHECMRVFHDRLINDGDRAWFVKELGKGVSDTFALDYAAKVLVPGLPLMFGSYLDHTSMPDKRKYRKVVEEATLHESMQYFLLDYNQNSGKRMSLVLFLNAMEHISRIIARIINQPYGNARCSWASAAAAASR
ncbi:1-aminocyclopropane-1-carboxylate synthase [Aureococcus anophagefferens]|nr:1-aminocyclopropane-1-carboxylate synthase [Aureococcus anophagefferens]